MTKKEIERMVDIAQHILSDPIAQCDFIGITEGVWLSRDDYEFIKPFLKANCIFTVTVGDICLTSDQSLFTGVALFPTKALVSMSESRRQRLAPVFCEAFNLFANFSKRTKYQTFKEESDNGKFIQPHR